MSRVHLKNHCEECRQRDELCICDQIPRIETQVQLLLIIHYGELKTTSNTGRVTAKCFPKHQILVRGLKNQPTGIEAALSNDLPKWILYPSDDAEILSDDWVLRNPGPIQLIVPDGTWRQASKVPNREPALKGIPKVTLPKGEPTQYVLRNEPHPFSLCTGEAIARAMEWLEGPTQGPKIRHQIESMIQLHQNRILFSRGELKESEARAFLPLNYRRPG